MLFEEQQIYSIERVEVFVLDLINLFLGSHFLSFNFNIKNGILQTFAMFKLLSSIIANRDLLKPSFRFNHVSLIGNNSQLTAPAKQVYIFDKDDTLVPLHQFTISDINISMLLSKLKQEGKRVYIVSNSVKEKGKRVQYYNDQKKIYQEIEILACLNKKPYNGSQIKAIIQQKQENKSLQLKLNSKNTVVIGDRLLTDVVLGNQQGWTTVLVDPIEPTSIKKHGMGVFLFRKIENIFIYSACQRYN